MRNVSTQYLEAIRARDRTDKLTGTLTLVGGTEVPLNGANISAGNTRVLWECVTGEELAFGSVIIAQLNFAIISDESRYAFYNARTALTYSIQLADGTWYDLPIGIFTVGETERSGKLVKMVAYDNLIKLDKDYGGAALYGTPYEIMVMISENCGIALGQDEDFYLSLPNGDQKIQIDETSGCKTYREAVRILAQLTACFVQADSSGSLVFKQFGKVPATTLTRAHFNTPSIADFKCNYVGLVIRATGREFKAYVEDEYATGLEMIISDAPAWDYGIDETLQQRCQNVLDELSQIEYTPSKFDMPSDLAIECGDLLELVTQDGVVNTLVTSITWQYKGYTSIESAGKNPFLYGITPKESTVIRELQSQTAANKLIFYSFTNQNAITAKDEEPKEIAQVTFVTTEATSAMFIAQLPLVVDCKDTVSSETTKNEVERTATVEVKDASGAVASVVDANGNPLTITVKVIDTDTDTVQTVTRGYVDVQVEYYLDGNLVDYELIQRCHAGSHILGLFYTFASLDGNANFQWQVKIKVVGGSGTVTVPKRGFRATVTGQGMAGTEAWDGTLNFDEGVEPIALRSSLTLVKTAEDVSVETQVPTPAGFDQAVAAISLRSRMTLGALSERVSTTEIRQKKTIDTAEWDYTDRYVEIVGSEIMARVGWTYQSEEQTIDQGRMTAVKAVTADLASVEEVTVSG